MDNRRKWTSIIVSVITCILEMYLLVVLFPQTGLARIVFIPMNVTIMIITVVIIIKVSGQKTLKLFIWNMAIMHLVLFHLYLLIWPQSAAIHRNLISEFYKIIMPW
jgi:hypothetical protein